MTHPRRQAAAALADFTGALTDADVDLPDLGDGWRITPDGTVLVQLRPLHLTELHQLARAVRPVNITP
ncbi:hypothetical protein OG455_17550 [Kitasatospora sp. NBC_01287]|uniref:hypothetical protein n=1 Tax=Kitasatospora sp. NBC_01287 TaxID=2903573 RepID=UPI0022594692|nr:hypothetical protein [Kitasatospora sp. NBC_01287]MCX4747304.1 hypothetical protein [Kitasatospora sp. NBC_01287]